MQIDSITKVLKSANQEGSFLNEDMIVSEGFLVSTSGKSSEYSIYEGWNLQCSRQCDQEWANDTINLLGSISQAGYDEDTLDNIINSIQSEDDHWVWVNKSLHCASDQYRWFYLYCEGRPQGVCLIFQPKESSLIRGDIFYIEFIAVAPWNRSNMHRERQYKGVGSILIRAALKYAVEVLGLTPGFSLLSLPQAETYYEGISMVHIESKDTPTMKHFELPTMEANQLLAAS